MSTEPVVSTPDREHATSNKPWLAIDSLPPSVLVLLGVGLIQGGAALAKDLFPVVGPSGMVFLRVEFAAISLFLLARPVMRDHRRVDYTMIVWFGLVIALMNLSIYQAMARLPIGVAVALEFIGPLTVALAGSRRFLDLVWVTGAAVGIALLTPWVGSGLDPVGMAFALIAAGCWAAYILLSIQVGRAFSGRVGLALAMGVAGIALAPVGLAGGGRDLLDPHVLVVGFAVAMLSTVVPYSLEMAALRRLPARLFSILVSTGPAVAALAGFVMLGETLGPRTLLAVVLITAAAVGAARSRHRS